MRSEALTLAFDTSAAHCAAALLQGETVLAHRLEEMAKGQAERLMPLLEKLLAEAGHNWRDLAAIGVGIGPGNFTGVRISVSAARGLALSLGIPAIGVSSFEAVAEGAARPIAVMLDARRGEAYAQRFTDAGAEPPRLEPAGVFQAELAGTPILTPEQATFPLAVAIARVAASRAETPQPKPAPLYLRGADAAPPSDPPPVLLD
ncbi:tRNA threonylcarbamoyl adenosine modification protein YeaZ [Rhodobacter aestuarii]|uniref:tRNA threonylcarbamoyl adenosine modification protein YeaZ n=1 Tax=Rhodobacter aestuarii TaxID=453582 RepID=A0A1N7PW01_9RHOB|nr:tRNA (adenosine(37)-N6)-threonylcarbamoyltransferase complex dimerization subunit type 1 TsaB [Rhodobacter aestuarii]PTV94132.1 tRNA threonylcarbamoyl adenosine modification protein YeaZ [Rhodobacter aestuarii]SIT14617.1 tRNA threonylcarbamoyl adenosine modification protein YeaZ [Rhodobacter aestuarii]